VLRPLADATVDLAGVKSGAFTLPLVSAAHADHRGLTHSGRAGAPDNPSATAPRLTTRAE
jgi:hypothetical protein